uniref:Svop-1 n=1 Tax=Pristionchus pacificus TaxID=54126 RepID=A0A2A6CHN1_PRIPA|eukprot:PDM77573.1 svop-1 [Pristionchus pacificus]
MGDKAILTEVLEASHLTDTYGDLTAKGIIKELRNVHSEEPSVRYSNLEDGRGPMDTSSTVTTPGGTERRKTYTVDDAVETLGFGRFQLKLSVLAGLAWMADAMEMMLLSLLTPALICEWGITSFEQALVTTCVFCGMMLSSTFWGRICDRIGRKWFLPTAQRAKCVVLIESFWAIGAVLEALLAFFVMNTWGWRSLWLPESARFHMSKGEDGKALETLMKVAKENGKQLPPGDLVASEAERAHAAKGGTTIFSLLSPDLRTTTLLVWLIWMVNAFSYYGMVLYTTVLFRSHDECHGGLFSNATSSETPDNHGTDHRMDRSQENDGRGVCRFYRIQGPTVSMVLPNPGPFRIQGPTITNVPSYPFRNTVIGLIFIGRAFISGAFQCAYVYTPEVYPTTLRASGLGAASGMARIGAIITPFVAQVAATSNLSYPVGIYGTAALIGLISALSLPIETKGRQMQEH